MLSAIWGIGTEGSQTALGKSYRGKKHVDNQMKDILSKSVTVKIFANIFFKWTWLPQPIHNLNNNNLEYQTA